jgi:hypothetical protein
MKKINLAAVIVPMLIFAACSGDTVKSVQSVPNLISEKFISDTEYEIVCIGFPKEGLSGVQKEESAKRAALLNAYYYSKNRFDDTVRPDVDGKVAKFSMYEDYAEIKYIISKSNLKKRLK